MVWLCGVLGACSGGGTAASGSQTGGGNDNNGTGGGASLDGGASGGSNQGGSDFDAGNDAILDGSVLSCTPKTCTELGTTCGPVADGCGGIVECGTCGEFQACGLFEPSVCGDVTKICTVTPPDCSGVECGLIGDGCSGSVDCGSCDNGEICGLNTPFQCDAPPPPDPEECPAKIVSCAAVGATCGKIGNGCGGLIDCDVETGGCEASELCGIEMPNRCSTPPTCTPTSPQVACANTCGQVANGCGELINCETEGFGCPNGQTCGGAGVAGQCGTEGTQTCTPFVAATVCAGKCGSVSDGCGDVIDCEANGNGGTVCGNGEWCGGGGTPSQCGKPACVPSNQALACNGKCGLVANGCGGLHQCNGCTGGAVCGFSVPNECGAPACQPIAAATACAGKCGKIGDGCGGIIDCALPGNGGTTCGNGEWCGGGGTANVCGKPACTPTDCATLGFTCGSAPNGCGGVLDCGGTSVCGQYATCLGNPATCVSGGGGGGSNSCPLCNYIPVCPSNSKTVITGRVTTPDGEVGVPNAYVYILKDNGATLPTISEGVSGGSCERCSDEDLGPLLASSLTTHTGAFRIETNIPVGTSFTLVVKAGKWRRAAVVPSGIVTGCTTTAIPESYSRLPANSNDGLGAHLPKIAISTGWVDEMECVFLKAGISASEFTVPSETGRIHMYRSDDNGGARMGSGCTCSGNTGSCTSDTSVNDTTLFDTQGAIDAYDLVVFDCEGDNYNEGSANDARIREYVNKGGRLFASHWSYSWLYDNNDGSNVANNAWETGLSQSADWSGSGDSNSDTAYISIGRTHANTTKIQSFAKWLANENAATITTDTQTGDALTGEFSVSQPRDLVKSVNEGADDWVYRTHRNGETRPHALGDTRVQQLSFNTPFGASAANVCGRVAYSAFHVANADNNDNNDYFPCVCDGTTLTAQEKVLLYMLFDLSACVSSDGPPPPPSCTAATAQTACPGKCGYVNDGCGGVVDCGDSCPNGQICNETTNQCVNQCNVLDCGDVGANCGYISDGCGEVVNCGTCSDGQVCGLYQANVCAQPVCTPINQATACANKCGTISDGCGGVLECGGCPQGQACGAGGPNICGVGICTPLDCAAQNIGCGMAGNGCGGVIQCDECTLPETCGGGGVPSQCGRPLCDPQSCQDVGAQCGFIGDGCGGSVDCGPCPNNGVCGGAGPNQCGGSCTPLTCDAVDAECGLVGDGCGDLVNCGSCPPGQVCGALEPNKCGDGPSCTPTTCEAAGAECGLVGDGCGQALDCGPCVAPEACGGAGAPNQCGKGDLGCIPRTCEAAGAECGALGDGCGALLDCGACPQGASCGSGGKPNECGPIVF